MATQLFTFVPPPQRMEKLDSIYTLPQHTLIYLPSATDAVYAIGQRLAQALAGQGIQAELTAANANHDVHLTLRVDETLMGWPESYRIVVNRNGVHLTGRDEAGLFYALCTLEQLLQQYPAENGRIRLPGLQVTDWPDFPHRAVMLDVTRDKVPTMETLFQIVDLLAGLKINQIQLYMEHVFAYRGHEVVWDKASPLTGEEILALDAYCRARYVELVPNQNSFGHMHRWLIHEPYQHLAEAPEGIEHFFSLSREPFSLCPIDPGSLDLLRDLYDQLLPHFRSRQFNVGLNETFDLGAGRSKQACKQRGKGRVYLDFLLSVHREVVRRGHTAQFWGDIILSQPELISELPQDIVALEWGYEAGHPFAEHGQLFAAAGLSFYVCPGTSSWNTFAGRTENALGNIRNAATSGKANGAIGLLNTDWGDNGHMQPLPISFLGFLAGAVYSWNSADAANPENFDLIPALDRYVFRDSAGVMGQLAYDLGNAYLQPGPIPPNSSSLFWLVLSPQGIPARRQRGKELSAEGLDQTLAYIDQVMGSLPEARMDRPDAQLIGDEFTWVADILRFACRLGQAWLPVGLDNPLESIPAHQRQELAQELRGLIQRYRDLWLRRNRPGGLEDSAARLERTLAALEMTDA